MPFCSVNITLSLYDCLFITAILQIPYLVKMMVNILQSGFFWVDEICLFDCFEQVLCGCSFMFRLRVQVDLLVYTRVVNGECLC